VPHQGQGAVPHQGQGAVPHQGQVTGLGSNDGLEAVMTYDQVLDAKTASRPSWPLTQVLDAKTASRPSYPALRPGGLYSLLWGLVASIACSMGLVALMAG